MMFLRISRSGNGVYGFAPTDNPEDKPNWMVYGSLANLKEFVEGKRDTFTLTFGRPR